MRQRSRAWTSRPRLQRLKFTLQIAAEDCTGCSLCVDVCPAKNKTEAKLKAINSIRRRRSRAGAGQLEFLHRPARIRPAQTQDDAAPPATIHAAVVRIQRRVRGLRRTPYVKMLSATVRRPRRLANATGCSSIYGGNLPTTPMPWTKTAAARVCNHCLRTTPSSASVSASRLTSKGIRRGTGEKLAPHWVTTS